MFPSSATTSFLFQNNIHHKRKLLCTPSTEGVWRKRIKFSTHFQQQEHPSTPTVYRNNNNDQASLLLFDSDLSEKGDLSEGPTRGIATATGDVLTYLTISNCRVCLTPQVKQGLQRHSEFFANAWRTLTKMGHLNDGSTTSATLSFQESYSNQEFVCDVNPALSVHLALQNKSESVWSPAQVRHFIHFLATPVSDWYRGTTTTTSYVGQQKQSQQNHEDDDVTMQATTTQEQQQQAVENVGGGVGDESIVETATPTTTLTELAMDASSIALSTWMLYAELCHYFLAQDHLSFCLSSIGTFLCERRCIRGSLWNGLLLLFKKLLGAETGAYTVFRYQCEHEAPAFLPRLYAYYDIQLPTTLQSQRVQDTIPLLVDPFDATVRSTYALGECEQLQLKQLQLLPSRDTTTTSISSSLSLSLVPPPPSPLVTETNYRCIRSPFVLATVGSCAPSSATSGRTYHSEDAIDTNNNNNNNNDLDNRSKSMSEATSVVSFVDKVLFLRRLDAYSLEFFSRCADLIPQFCIAGGFVSLLLEPRLDATAALEEELQESDIDIWLLDSGSAKEACEVLLEFLVRYWKLKPDVDFRCSSSFSQAMYTVEVVRPQRRNFQFISIVSKTAANVVLNFDLSHVQWYCELVTTCSRAEFKTCTRSRELAEAWYRGKQLNHNNDNEEGQEDDEEAVDLMQYSRTRWLRDVEVRGSKAALLSFASRYSQVCHPYVKSTRIAKTLRRGYHLIVPKNVHIVRERGSTRLTDTEFVDYSFEGFTLELVRRREERRSLKQQLRKKPKGNHNNNNNNNNNLNSIHNENNSGEEMTPSALLHQLYSSQMQSVLPQSLIMDYSSRRPRAATVTAVTARVVGAQAQPELPLNNNNNNIINNNNNNNNNNVNDEADIVIEQNNNNDNNNNNEGEENGEDDAGSDSDSSTSNSSHSSHSSSSSSTRSSSDSSVSICATSQWREICR
jgi:hypothetical protein